MKNKLKNIMPFLITTLFILTVIGCNASEVFPDKIAGMIGAENKATQDLVSIATVSQKNSNEVYKIQVEQPSIVPSSIQQSPIPYVSEVVSPAPNSSLNPQSTPEANLSPSPQPSPSATASNLHSTEPTSSQTKQPSSGVLSGKIIGLDPGHQSQQNSSKEPVAPGSSEMKIKVTSGTEGISTNIPEHKVNLQVALKLKELLENAGATVVMTRQNEDVDISNAERAQIFNEKNVDLAIRIHCNGEDDTSLNGAFMLIPEKNPFLAQCESAAQVILEAYCDRTGLKNRGISVRGDQTGFNWCERPIINIEMGHMSNAEEDKKLTNSAFQQDMALGVFDGIANYFS